jgi:Fic family protein
MYIYDQKSWPKFTWQDDRIGELLIAVRHQQGLLLGGMKSIGFQLSDEVVLATLTQDVVKSSEIEGELLDKSTVRSSVARHLGMDVGALGPVDRHVEGVVEMILDATQKYKEPLTQERLFGWHAALFPTGYSGLSKINVAGWRTGPMQVISGRMGNPIIHFEGPAAQKVPYEMEQFLDWCNSQTQIDPVLKAGLAHFWFVTIHPFEDGNGRIARAICDLFLARSDKTERRFYSLSENGFSNASQELYQALFLLLIRLLTSHDIGNRLLIYL